MPVGVRRDQCLVPAVFGATLTQVYGAIADDLLSIYQPPTLWTQTACDSVEDVLADWLLLRNGQMSAPYQENGLSHEPSECTDDSSRLATQQLPHANGRPSLHIAR